ncbi:hypothetical protein F5Y00DRAFT_259138 [Daldinia vernicosa]|uniref:uncharacterized protein n=1 Tax=Daldinia vernicosa TaxID=114800 RepID=UPI0020084D07|nr:uncharacterized protein F5Y00DRAFT_259138 [Daldinia vernicosa]KAI0851650.1 hypothetical protein F5Y00DRAFT_259138 [Daldinia vernicosa]
MSGGLPTPVRSPESDVSPRSQPSSKKTDYFSLDKRTSPLSRSSSARDSAKSTPRTSLVQPAATESKGKGKETAESTGDASATTPGETASSTGSSGPPSRKASISSISFAPPRHPSLPQGLKKPHAGNRIRAASPPHHVYFAPFTSRFFECKDGQEAATSLAPKVKGCSDEGAGAIALLGGNSFATEEQI